MAKDGLNEEPKQKKFQMMIGEKIAYVEIISLNNYICAVEFAGKEPIFITRIRDENNQPRWVSIPQGNDELAITVGNYLEKEIHFHEKN